MASPIEIFFENYAKALSSYSAERISEFYQTPLAIYSDNGIQFVSDQSEVVSFWKEGVKPYQGMNISKTDPDVLQEEQLSETVCVAKVFWRNFNADGQDIQNETNFYILTRSRNGLKIAGLIIMTK